MQMHGALHPESRGADFRAGRSGVDPHVDCYRRRDRTELSKSIGNDGCAGLTPWGNSPGPGRRGFTLTFRQFQEDTPTTKAQANWGAGEERRISAEFDARFGRIFGWFRSSGWGAPWRRRTVPKPGRNRIYSFSTGSVGIILGSKHSELSVLRTEMRPRTRLSRKRGLPGRPASRTRPRRFTHLL